MRRVSRLNNGESRFPVKAHVDRTTAQWLTAQANRQGVSVSAFIEHTLLQAQGVRPADRIIPSGILPLDE